MSDELVSPLNEILHVRRVCVSTFMLTPCKLAVQNSLIHRGHFRCVIIPLNIEAFGTEQGEHTARVHDRDELLS